MAVTRLARGTLKRALPLIAALLPALLAMAAARPRASDALFPLSSMVDFSFLLDPPAGKHGFLGVDPAGRFVWPNGKRARFWGVNISGRSVFVSRETVDRVVPVLARSGVNMVRFEALDSRGGLLEDTAGKPVRSPDPEKLAALDYWAFKLRSAGIYYYLNLLDLRTFRESDGLPEAASLPRAGRPYAVFDPVLIALQEEYAGDLLLHTNPHTGLRYVDDPALALVEICNESGFFLRPEELERMPTRIAGEFSRLWNEWLRARYGSRERLAAAWGDALAVDEDPAKNTVRTPLLRASAQAPNVVDPRMASVRRADGVRFLQDLQAQYFEHMRAYLRDLGLRVPVTAVTSRTHPAEGASSASLDFCADNYFCDHPVFAGAGWQSPLHFMDTNPLRESGPRRIGGFLGALRWGRKPIVVREWAQPWPNRYRCVSPAEVVAYGSLHDADGFLLFGYQIAMRPEVLGDFDFQCDPAVWGLFGPAALSYLRGDIRPGPLAVVAAHNDASLSSTGPGPEDIYRIGWLTRVRNVEASRPEAGAVRPSFPAASSAASVAATLRRQGLLDGRLTPPPIVSAGGQIRRDTAAGVLQVSSALTVILSGEIGGKTWQTGPLRVRTLTPVATVWAVSLDGRPLTSSQKYLIKMVGDAANTGQLTAPASRGAPARYRLVRSGGPPVHTFGTPADGGLSLALGNRWKMVLNLRGGVWELLVEGDRATLLCDTAVTGRLQGRLIRTTPGVPVEVSVTQEAAGRAPK